jgi:hypothetical protein
MERVDDADRIRALVVLRAACETVLSRLDVDDLELIAQIGDLRDALRRELEGYSSVDADPEAD